MVLAHSPHELSRRVAIGKFFLRNLLSKKLAQRLPAVFNSPFKKPFWRNKPSCHYTVLSVDLISELTIIKRDFKRSTFPNVPIFHWL
jgi:hypothetical protein